MAYVRWDCECTSGHRFRELLGFGFEAVYITMVWHMQFKSSVDPKKHQKGALARRIPNKITHTNLVFGVKGYNGCRENGEHLYQPTKVDLYGNDGVCVCVDLLKRSKTCTWISIFGSLWDLYLDGILTNLTYMKFKLQILYWFIARLRGLPLWYFIFGWHAYYFNLHEVCSFKFYSRGHRPIVDTCANEAIPQWGKLDLISHVYLQIFGIDMVINKCLVIPWFSCWKAVVSNLHGTFIIMNLAQNVL